MKCPVCRGNGEIDNPRYWNISPVEAYERGLKPTKPCKKCGGRGWIIGNYNDIIGILDEAVGNNRGLSAKETKQIYELIKN